MTIRGQVALTQRFQPSNDHQDEFEYLQIMRTSTFEDEDIGVLADDLDLVGQALVCDGQALNPAPSEEES
ncbi:MAG: hypothetical protein Q8L05_11175 [Actinomycetota bacterium]|nr:hypothetical protein [Actinomycetota bacterium]